MFLDKETEKKVIDIDKRLTDLEILVVWLVERIKKVKTGGSI